MRIAVSGGGSAGHVSPVLAVVAALQKRDPALKVVFIGQAGDSASAELVRAAGLRFVGIGGGKIRRIPGAGWRNLLRAGDMARNARDGATGAAGTLQASWILRRFRPDVVFNKGGTIGWPVGLACRWLNIPMVIHEPDLVPGLGNRVMSRWAAAVAVGFPLDQYRDFPPDTTTYTGNPVQPAMLQGSGAAAITRFGLDSKRPVVLVVGGSQGAAAVNAAVTHVLPELLKRAQVIHVAGQRSYDEVRAATAAAGHDPVAGYHVVPFLPLAEMADAYRAATLVVARAGANTIAELAALRKAAIILPNHEAAAHQVKNAQWLADRQAAIVLPKEEAAALLAAASELLSSSKRRHDLERAIATCGTPNATDRLADLIVVTAGTHTGTGTGAGQGSEAR